MSIPVYKNPDLNVFDYDYIWIIQELRHGFLSVAKDNIHARHEDDRCLGEVCLEAALGLQEALDAFLGRVPLRALLEGQADRLGEQAILSGRGLSVLPRGSSRGCQS